MLVLWLWFTLVFILWWIKSLTDSFEVQTSYWREFFSWMKSSKISKLYFSTFLLRRIIWVWIVVMLNRTSRYLQTAVFAIPNIIWLIYSVSVRPFELIKDNIIEVFNDFTFGFFSILMIYFNTKSVHYAIFLNFIYFYNPKL